MECKVDYIAYEMECDESYTIGDTVNWVVSKCKNTKNSDAVENGDYEYYYHNRHCMDFEKMFVLQGRVKEIRTEFFKYKFSKLYSIPDNKPIKGYLKQPVSDKVIASKHAPCEMSDIENITGLDEMEEHQYFFVIEDYIVKPFLEVYKLPWLSENRKD